MGVVSLWLLTKVIRVWRFLFHFSSLNSVMPVCLAACMPAWNRWYLPHSFFYILLLCFVYALFFFVVCLLFVSVFLFLFHWLPLGARFWSHVDWHTHTEYAVRAVVCFSTRLILVGIAIKKNRTVKAFILYSCSGERCWRGNKIWLA